MTEYQIDVARKVIGTKAKQFEAALRDVPDSGKIRPVGYEPWLAAVMADFQKQPKLCQAAEEAPETVWECLSAAASIGLVPGASGHFYLIPRFSKRRQRMECTHIVGYKGYCELAYRHPRVHKVEAFLVMEGDEFEWTPGRDCVHRINPDVSRLVEEDLSNVKGAYARIVLTIHNSTSLDPDPVIEWMTREELLAIRKRSESAGKGFSPWKTDPGRMARKCPIRRAAGGGSLPQSPSLIVAIGNESRQEEALATDLQVSPVEVATSGLRQAAGIPELPHWDFVEEAVAWVKKADEHQLKALTSASMPFDGADADTLATAVGEREEELAELEKRREP